MGERTIEQVIKTLVNTLPYQKRQIEAVLTLLAEGNTVPFIARYRKEKTGALDEVQIREIEQAQAKEIELQKRKESVCQSIAQQEKLTPALQQKLAAATTLAEVEDLYLPYKQKKKTKATVAKEQGLEPLALLIKEKTSAQPQKLAENFLTKEVPTVEVALAGAHEILAEALANEATLRQQLRQLIAKEAIVHSERKKEAVDEKERYQMYYDFEEAAHRLPAYRILALNRGEKEKVLKIKFLYNKEKIESKVGSHYFGLHQRTTEREVFLHQVVHDSLKRFIFPALERELRKALTEKAEQQAIEIFGVNLQHLLLQVPLKGKVVLGLDPAYRTGCKLAIVDATGKLLAVDVIYPTLESKKEQAQAKRRLLDLIQEYKVEMIAIGNGTASRESEHFVSECLKEMTTPVYYVIVSEAGASVYSASELAREEFPDLPVEKRSAISIARRLQDPLAELVKIDPKSIGVGQYQHDVSQKALTQQLDFVVDTAVNKVGVNVNTASKELLQHIAGLTATTAQNIVRYREEFGPFQKRQELKNVPRLGPKAYEQAIGFLRIPEGSCPLDNTEVHPESYDLAQAILTACHLEEAALGTTQAETQLANLSTQLFAEQNGYSLASVQDVVASLQKSGRDIRDTMPAPLLRQDVQTIADLKVGMQLQGTVRNVVDFGAFVDIGVKEDGLVHISELSTRFVRHPSEVVQVGDIVQVKIKAIDLERHKIQLSMKDCAEK